VPGTGVALQLASDQFASVAPVQEPLAACNSNAPASKSKPVIGVNGFIFMCSYGLCFGFFNDAKPSPKPSHNAAFAENFADECNFQCLTTTMHGIMASARNCLDSNYTRGNSC
jgi:hypothetical protein